MVSCCLFLLLPRMLAEFLVGAVTTKAWIVSDLHGGVESCIPSAPHVPGPLGHVMSSGLWTMGSSDVCYF